MNRHNLLILLVVLLPFGASAQVTWNLRAGMGVSGLMTDANVNPKPSLAAMVSLGMELPLSLDFSFLPSVGYAMKGGRYDFNAYNGTENLHLHYLQVPLLFGYRLNMGSTNLIFKAGPYLEMALSGTLKQEITYAGQMFSSETNIFSKDALEKAGSRFDVGAAVGIDYEIKRFLIGVEAEMGFISLAPNNMNLKNLAAYVSIGYKF